MKNSYTLSHQLTLFLRNKHLALLLISFLVCLDTRAFDKAEELSSIESAGISRQSTDLITNITASSGKTYSQAALAVGARAYTDRTYEITSVPSVLTGTSLIQTANDDKKSTSTALLSFDLSQNATVYVAYDPRATALPTWLSSWQKLTDKIGINDSKISTMDLYSKSYAAGTVTLGGNWASPAAGAETNYFVVAKGEGTSTTQYTLTVSTTGSGTVTKNPNQSSYDSGTIVSLTATAASGYVFSGWSGDASGTTNPLSVTMNSNKSITANFSSTQSSTSLVSNITSTTGKSYTLTTLVAGVNLYTDRTYQVTGVPSSLNGEAFIQTPNDDKKNTSTSVVSFSLSQDATVFVGYDPRATALPTWLSTWQKLSDKLNTNDPGTSTLDIYSKSYPAGTVTLGGNMASPAAGSQTNYVVAVKQQASSSQEIKVNFQVSTTNTPSGYLADRGQSFDTGRGYGWVDPSTKQPKDLTANMRERSTTDEFRLRTLAQMQASNNGQVPGSWEYVLPNGSYNVSVSVGDPSYTDSNHSINVEGVTAISNFKPTSSQKFQSATVAVEVTDGKLTIDAAGGTNTKLNYAIISSTTPGTDITPPVVSVKFAGTQVSPNVFKDEVQITIEASDAGGSGLASVQYSLNGAAYKTYTAPFKVTTLGDHTIQAKAVDGNNNQTITDVYNFSVTNATKSNAYMVLENMDKFLAPDVLTFSRIEIPWRRQNEDGSYTPYNANHDKVRLRIHNKGTGTLIISNLALTNTTGWKIALLNGVDYNASTMLPLSIASKAHAELVVEFIAPNQGTRVSVLQGALNISSNDDLAPFKTVKLFGLWQKEGEGNDEPYAKEIIAAFGLKTNVGFNANDGSSNKGTTVVANSDEILSPYFVRVDPSKPVYVIQIAAYHGCCSSTETIRWHAKGSSTNTTIVTHHSEDGQTLLPRKNTTTPVPADGSFSPSGAFGISVQKSYTDRTRNFEGKIGIRIWKARDANGNIIPNAYILGMDYLDSPFVNYDYQDNIYYISNLKPEVGAAHYSELGATPSAVEFGGVLTGSSKNLSVSLKNLGKTYADGSSDPSIVIKSVEVVGPNSGEFRATMPSTTTLSPQGTTSTTASFIPTSLGIKNATLLVHYNSAASPLRVPLYGIANDGSSTISVVKRIKGAADVGVTIGGKAWEADINYRAGSIKLDKQNVTTPIAATDEDVLYQTYLSASSDLAETRYNIPLSTGNYMVRMHFVENFFSATGSRVFDITMENTKKLTAFDIYSEVGYRTALVKDFDISVTDGTLNIKYNPTANRLAIAGLEIFRATSTLSASSTESVQIASEGLKLQVYPNPNSGDRMQMALEGFGQREKVDIKIYDLTGRAVESLEVTVNELGTSSTNIAVSKRLSRGLYIIKAQAASGEVRARLLIE